ncbi:LysE family translocator [Planktotalea sp.]|uniref:LysE family translocator n=1 Tax=Planktotalea sp. TaxID=2029877 RepID=UPI0032997E09
MLDLYLFVPACFAINLAFGPNNLLALTHGAQRGVSFALAAGLGRLAVFVVMIAASALGLGIILSTSALIFTVVKVIGAAYLIWLGWKSLKSAFSMKESDLTPGTGGLRAASRIEALTASSNPKAILVFAAFFPQFVVTEAYVQSYATLGAIFLVLEFVALGIYAAGGALAARTAARKLHWFQGASGVGMMFFGGLLLFAKRPS